MARPPSSPRSRSRGTNGSGTHVPVDVPDQTTVNEDALAALTPPKPETPKRPIVAKDVRFGVMTERGYVPRSETVRLLCPLFLPDLELYVTFNTSIAFGYIGGGYEMEGDSPVEKFCRKLMLEIGGFEGWNFFDPWKNEPIPEPSYDDWTTWQPLVVANGVLTSLGLWLDGVGMITALNATMGNSSPA